MMNNITLYTIGCPKCKILARKLDEIKLNYNTVSDIDKIIEVGKSCNIMSAPILQVNDKYYDFSGAMKIIKENIVH